MTGLCECGCLQRTSIPTASNPRINRTRGVPMRFVHGHNSRCGTRRGEGSPVWMGDRASYSALHRWLRENFPKTGTCEECGNVGKTDLAFKRHPERHTRDRDDYRELCRSCHVKFDTTHKAVA